MRELPLELERQRLGWWLVGAVLLAVLLSFVWTFVDVFVLGLFVYYVARPLHRRFLSHLDSRGLEATLTMLVIVMPVLLLLGYVGFVAYREFTAVVGPGVARRLFRELPTKPESLATILRHPLEFLRRLESIRQLRQHLKTGLKTLGFISAGLLHLSLALSLTFFLLRDGARLEGWFREQVASEGTPPYAYLSAVDEDLETVYFGNVVTVLLVTGLSVLVYNGFNFFVPRVLHLPFPTLLAVLTGLATFVPLVVGKLVYVPATTYLVWEAYRVDPRLIPAVVVFFVVSFFLLDLLPQTVLRPIISGRGLHSGMILFAYVLGVAYFGWYGLFLGPLFAVLLLQFANVIFPDLLHGDDLSASASQIVHIGHDPEGGTDASNEGSAAGEEDETPDESVDDGEGDDESDEGGGDDP